MHPDSAHMHPPGGHGLLEVRLHLVSGPTQLFQRSSSVEVRKVQPLEISLALSASLAAALAAAARSMSAARLRSVVRELVSTCNLQWQRDDDAY